MMKALAALALLAILGVGAYFLLARSDDPAAQQAELASSEEAEGQTLTGSGSFRSILGLGQNLTCDFTHVDPETNSRTEGTTYLAGERMRGDFVTTETDGSLYTMSTIHDTEYAYTWGDGPEGTMAMKFAITDADDADEFEYDEADDSWESDDLLQSDDAVEYSCENWRVDQSKFIPPSDIEFEDMSLQLQQMQQMQLGAGADAASQCGMCDQLPEDARAECRVALGC